MLSAVDSDDPKVVAKSASLRYVNDARPGITRVKSGTGFSYKTADGNPLRDAPTLERIKAIVIPPAWTEVWICPLPNGHIQATGRDAKGRKQHRYHERWRAVRDESKYQRLVQFSRSLPSIRSRVSRDLAANGMPQQRVLAMVVRLLETTYIRIGNEQYARDNGSYGLTTLTDDHVEIRGAKVRFNFRGKSGKAHNVEISDRRLAKLVRKSRDLPGQELFQYVDDEGVSHPIDSADVNEYIRNCAKGEFTAKDFRTWAGTRLAARALAVVRNEYGDKPLPKAALVRAVKEVSGCLGNTPAVCRKCYVHPAILELFTDPARLKLWDDSMDNHEKIRGLSVEEAALVHFLEFQDK